MRIHFAVVSSAALALALGSFSAEAAQRGERRTRSGEAQAQGRSGGNSSARARGNQDRGSRVQGETRRSSNAANPRRDSQVNRSGAVNRAVPRSSVDRSRNTRVDQRTSRDRGRNPRVNQRTSPDRRRNPRVDTRRTYNRGLPRIRRNHSRTYAPRLIPRWSAPRRYYGPGGGLSLYFDWGTGYRYGSFYTGRVYGYRGRVVSGYGNYRYYGDLRLKVTPRDAAVYVDGYYAGIVDDFDGFFQRLTVEAGPHVIEIDAPGLEPQVFEVYVDGSRTIDLHADLIR